MNKRGRPPKYDTADARADARREQNKQAAARYRVNKRAARPKLEKRQKRKVKHFRAFDGEGRLIGDDHRLVLLGTRLDVIENKNGLSTLDCLEFLTRDISPKGTARIFYAFGYDVAHIVRDLPPEKIELLYHAEPVSFGKYELFFIPRKIFRIKCDNRRYTYYDVFTFFNMAFVKALEKYLPGEVPRVITEGKAGRAFFGSWDLKAIRDYHRIECEYLELLMQRIAELLGEKYPDLPSLMPRGWYGPGAVANRLLRALEVGRMVYPEREYSSNLQNALTRAYFGGRIEAYQIGTTQETVYRYDIRSAYPYWMKKLPLLKFRKEWHRTRKHNPDVFGVWRVRWDLTHVADLYPLPGPFPWRDEKGKILCRASGEGWYWQPEVNAALKYFAPYMEIIDGYYMEPPYTYPMADTIQYLYNLRAQLKAESDPREYPLKIALNSGYGKLAQREGVARYRSLCWAGYITAGCRSQMLIAMMEKPEAILASLTDGILTTAPLNVNIGPDLGQWEVDAYSGAVIILPGIYRLGKGKTAVNRWRGYNVKHFDFDRIIKVIAGKREARLLVNMFVSPLLANHAPNAYGPYRCGFVRRARVISPFNTHKRIYDGRGSDLPTRLLGSIMPGTLAREIELSAPYSAFEISEIERELNHAEDTAIAHDYAITLDDFLAVVD